MAQQPLLGQGLPTFEASSLHSDTAHSIGPLCTSDQPVAETSNIQHIIHTTDIHSPDRIRTRNPYMRAAANPCLRPRGHGDRLILYMLPKNIAYVVVETVVNLGGDVEVGHRDLNSGKLPSDGLEGPR